MGKKAGIVIAAGVLLVAGAVAALSQTGGAPFGRFGHGHGHGGHGGGQYGFGWGPGGFGDDGGIGQGFGGWRDRWRGEVTRDEFDARTRERFARLDRNNDGVIDAAEVEAMLSGRMRSGPMRHMAERMGGRMLRVFDADRDGRVTRDEMIAGVRRVFAEMDLDGDGRITDADLPPMLRGRGVLSGEAGGRDFGRGGMGGLGRMGGPLMELLRDADADRDGTITLEEAIAAAERRFALLDRNRDAAVDRADRETLQKETLDYRVRRFMHHFGARDGRITREQFTAKAGERFALMDLDNDGTVRRDEMPGRGGRHWHGGEGRGWWHRGGPEGRGGPFGRGGADGDGQAPERAPRGERPDGADRPSPRGI